MKTVAVRHRTAISLTPPKPNAWLPHVPFSALQRLCRPAGLVPRVSTVCRWADREEIRYKYDAQGGIWATWVALNAALGLGGAAPEMEREEDLI